MIKSREKTCMSCGEIFQMRRSDARYCSEVCKQRAYKERKQLETAEDVYNETSDIHFSPLESKVIPKLSTIDHPKEPIKYIDETLNKTIQPSEIKSLIKQDNRHPSPVVTDNNHLGNRKGMDLSEYEGTFILKGFEVSKSLKLFYSEEELQKMEPQIDENGELFFSMMNQSTSLCNPEMISKGNAHLADWIKRIFAMAERFKVKIEKLEELEEELKDFQASFDYRWLRKKYPYRAFIEKELHPRIKNWLNDIHKQKANYFTLTPEDSWKQKYLILLKVVSRVK